MPRRHVRIEEAQMPAELRLRLVRRAKPAAIDVAVAEASGEGDLPRPAMLHRGRDGLRGNRGLHRRWDRHRCIVEQIAREAYIRRVQRLVDQETREAAAVDEEVRRYRLALLRADRGEVAVGVEVRVRHMAALVAHAAIDRFAVQELPEQHGVEVIAVPDIEGEALARLRGATLGGQARSDEVAVRMRLEIGAVDARLDVVDELLHRQVVQHRGEGVEVAPEPRLGRPAVEADAAVVGRVAGGHPLRLLEPQAVEEAAEPRGRALTNADDSDRGGLQQRDLDASLDEGARE